MNGGPRGVRLSLPTETYSFSPETRTLNEKCGIFGIYGPGEDVARQTYFGIYTLQHRGQESAGIAVTDGTRVRTHKEMGLVSQVFDEEDLRRLTGFAAIGHTRYSTTGSSRIENAQPVVMTSDIGPIAMGHNGNLVNSQELRTELAEMGLNLETSTDSELILAMVANAPGATLVERIQQVFPKLSGSFSLVFLSLDKIVAVRDNLGNRPLCLGSYNGTWLIASESCAFGALKAKFERDILAGEILQIDDDGPRSFGQGKKPPSALCVFEFIYFARPDSVIEGATVYDARMRLGAALAKQHPVQADLVIGVPDSATAAAIGYAKESKIPFTEGLVKSRYIGRTFIEPEQSVRDFGVRLKLNPVRSVISGQRVVLIDDSIVRGTTSRKIVRMLRDAGAREVHMRISCPPTISPCFYGVDTPSKKQLIAANKSVDEIRDYIGADSLAYLSMEGMREACGDGQKTTYCTACYTGSYPTAWVDVLLEDVRPVTVKKT